MVNCHYAEYAKNPQGEAVRHEKFIQAQNIGIGRYEASEIYLPDGRVSLHHANITRHEDGEYLVQALDGQLIVQHALVQQAQLQVGTEFWVGPYQFEVMAIGTDSISIISNFVHEESILEHQAIASAASNKMISGISVRCVSWILIGAIFACFLAWPMVEIFIPHATKITAITTLNPQGFWRVGALSNAHRNLNVSCVSCHATPFTAVSNSSCLKCHATIADHGMLIQQHLNLKGGMRCTSCHAEHQDKIVMANISEQVCIKCHATLKKTHPTTTLGNASDFAKAHPNFKLSVPMGLDASDVKRITQMPHVQTDNLQPQNVELKEQSNINFSHVQHMGDVAIPWDMMNMKNLKCASCHEVTEDKQSFKPISFEKHCFECHQDQLELNTKDINRKLPHTNSTLITQTLNDAFSSLARKNGKPDAWVNQQVNTASKSLTNEGEGCAYCHTIKPKANENMLFDVAPVLSPQHWFVNSKFPHNEHGGFKCADCHSVEKSDTSANIAIPNRQTCLQCHAGAHAAETKIGTTCMSCHTFHDVVKKDLPANQE